MSGQKPSKDPGASRGEVGGQEWFSFPATRRSELPTSSQQNMLWAIPPPPNYEHVEGYLVEIWLGVWTFLNYVQYEITPRVPGQ